MMLFKALLGGFVVFCIFSAGAIGILYIFGQPNGYIALVVAGLMCVFFETEVNKFLVWVGKKIEKL